MVFYSDLMGFDRDFHGDRMGKNPWLMGFYSELGDAKMSSSSATSEYCVSYMGRVCHMVHVQVTTCRQHALGAPRGIWVLIS